MNSYENFIMYVFFEYNLCASYSFVIIFLLRDNFKVNDIIIWYLLLYKFFELIDLFCLRWDIKKYESSLMVVLLEIFKIFFHIKFFYAFDHIQVVNFQNLTLLQSFLY